MSESIHTLRILIADDHALVRRGVRNLLSHRPEWHVVCEAVNGLEAVEKARDLQPDVAILDFSMPLLDGSAAAKQIMQASPSTAIVVLTMHDSDEVIREVLRSGARGLVLKTDADQDLVEAIEAVATSRYFFARRVNDMVVEGYLTGAKPVTIPNPSTAQLTPREQEVLRLLAEGAASKQIASRLAISVRTVESHRIHVNRKLGFSSVAELVRYAIRHGVI